MAATAPPPLAPSPPPPPGPAEAACADGDVDLVVVDGPLRGRQHLMGAVGYIKTHHVTYLAPELNAVVGRLAPGERSPLFILGTDWSRLSWYFRLAAAGP